MSPTPTLTDEQIARIALDTRHDGDATDSLSWLTRFARAILAASPTAPPDTLKQALEALESARKLLDRCGPHLQGVEPECCGNYEAGYGGEYMGQREDVPVCCCHPIDLSDYVANELSVADAAIASLQSSLAAPPDTTGRVDAGAVEHVASQWDGCLYENSIGGDIDIGAAIREAFNNFVALKTFDAPASSAGGGGSEALVRAVIAHIDGWKSATFGWQGDPDPAKAKRNQQAAIENHAAECLRRIRVTLAAPASPAPAVVQGEVPRG